MITNKRVFKGGRYFVGDPALVISNSNWVALYKYLSVGFFVHNGLPCFSSIVEENGTYVDNLGRVYHIEFGFLGIMPEQAMDKNFIGEGGNMLMFNSDFLVSFEGGIFRFGGLEINTSRRPKFEEIDQDAESEEFIAPSYQLPQPEKRGRGRPRIHPIVERTTPKRKYIRRKHLAEKQAPEPESNQQAGVEIKEEINA